MISTQGEQSIVEVVIHEGRNRIVRRLLDHVGHPVQRLTRTRIGPVALDRLRQGTLRELTRDELGICSTRVGSRRVLKNHALLRGARHARWLRSRRSTRRAFPPPPCHRTHRAPLATSGFLSTLLAAARVCGHGKGS